MIKTTAILVQELSEYKNPLSKINRMVSEGKFTPIIKGLYETDSTVPAHYLATSICAPSYVSFEYALSYYSLIPEAVYACTSATYRKRRTKKYETPFGLFTYADVPADAFPFCVDVREENGYAFLMASPEKAVCDRLYKTPPVGNQNELEHLLFDDMRIDESGFAKLNFAIMTELAPKYRSTSLNLLRSYLIRRGK